MSREVEEEGGNRMEVGDWKSPDSSLTAKSGDPSLVLKTVDGKLLSKSSFEISNSELNNRTALRVEAAEAGYGQKKVSDIYMSSDPFLIGYGTFCLEI